MIEGYNEISVSLIVIPCFKINKITYDKVNEKNTHTHQTKQLIYLSEKFRWGRSGVEIDSFLSTLNFFDSFVIIFAAAASAVFFYLICWFCVCYFLFVYYIDFNWNALCVCAGVIVIVLEIVTILPLNDAKLN